MRISPPKLTDLLAVKRPHGSAHEERWIKAFIDPLGAKPDQFGNRILRIGKAPVLWSSHTDTVHYHGGEQSIRYRKGILSLRRPSKSDCLGADDAAGVWLMLRMIARGVEGLYVFHRGEEAFGLGSKFIADKTPELLHGIDYAIALDRGQTGSIITHQLSRCCSDDFAKALAGALGPGHSPDDTGIFTDTANYTSLIPECTNLSVGYEGAHTSHETVDLKYLRYLLEQLVKVDVQALPVKRDPSVADDWLDHYYSGYYGGKRDWQADSLCASVGKSTGHKLPVYEPPAPLSAHDDFDRYVETIRQYPDIAADYLEQCGVTCREFRATAWEANADPELLDDQGPN